MQDKTREKEIAFRDYLFTINYRRTYKYPPNIEKMESELKAAKKEAEVSGEAFLISDTGYVTLKKKENNHKTT